MCFQKFAQRNAHGFFDVAGPFNVTGDAEELGAGIVRTTYTGKPRGAASQDIGYDGDGLHIVDGRRTTIKPDICRERRLQPWLPFLAFQAFQ